MKNQMIAVPAQQLTIGYWKCRALGAPLRMMAAFKQLAYTDTHYEVSSRLSMSASETYYVCHHVLCVASINPCK